MTTGAPGKGSRITLVAVPGMRFGNGTVIDPEVRVPQPGRPGVTARCARLRCTCGQVYLAQLTKLFSGERKSCGCLRRGRPRGGPGGRVYPNKGGYAVTVYAGWFKTRAEADDVARRARVVVLPETPVITGI